MFALTESDVCECICLLTERFNFTGDTAFSLLVAHADAKEREVFVVLGNLDVLQLSSDKRRVSAKHLKTVRVKCAFHAVDDRGVAVVLLVHSLSTHLLLYVSENQNRGFLGCDIDINTSINVIQRLCVSNSREEGGVHIRCIADEYTFISRDRTERLNRADRANAERVIVEVQSFQNTVEAHKSACGMLKKYCFAVDKQCPL